MNATNPLSWPLTYKTKCLLKIDGYNSKMFKIIARWCEELLIELQLEHDEAVGDEFEYSDPDHPNGDQIDGYDQLIYDVERHRNLQMKNLNLAICNDWSLFMKGGRYYEAG